jgi:hypothetical protein
MGGNNGALESFNPATASRISEFDNLQFRDPAIVPCDL